MTVELAVSNGGPVFTHNPPPSIIINETFRKRENSTDLAERLVTWQINGVITPVGGDIADQVAALRAVYELGELSYAKWQIAGGAILEQMPTERNIVVESLSFPTGNGPEWATKRKYTISLSSSEYSIGINTDGDYEYTTEYSTEENGLITRTVNGKLVDLVGEDASTKYTALKSTMGWGAWAGANKINDTYSINDNNSICVFSISHKGYFIAYPTGILAGDATTDTKTDNQGVTRVSISGSFVGSAGDCTNAIDTLRPSSSVLIEESITRNDYEYKTDFSVSYISTAANDIIQSQESLTIVSQHYDFVMKRVLGGFAPVKQLTSLSPGRAVQTGTIKRLSTYPSAPAYYWAVGDLKGESITRVSPEYRVGAGYMYGLNYSYEFEFIGNPTF